VLRGALACQAKRDGSAFDPDERKSLDVLNALTALNASIEDGFATLAARIDALRAGEKNAAQ
jgi:hypothetical protein